MSNKILATLVKGLVRKNIKEWDLKLPHVEFAYNRTTSFVVAHSPFKSCNGINPLTPLELIPLLLEFRLSHDAKESIREIMYNARANKNIKARPRLRR